MEEENLGIVIGTIISADKVKGADRLHIIKVDIGGEIVQIASGVPADFEQGHLINKQIPLKIDVQSVKIRGIESQARFITTIGANNKAVLLVPEENVPKGSKVW